MGVDEKPETKCVLRGNMVINDWLELSGRLNRSFDDKAETGVQEKFDESD